VVLTLALAMSVVNVVLMATHPTHWGAVSGWLLVSVFVALRWASELGKR